jgi:hypothetical protein
MLKFEKNGKKLMEMDEEGNIIYHDAKFKAKMGALKEKLEKEQEEANDDKGGNK